VGSTIVKLKTFWLWLISKLFPRYTLRVSYNNTWGDQDDQEFIVKKFHKTQDKYLKFITHEGDLVEIRGADGLNYRIEQL
jgi:hypothetical protein